MSLYSPGIVGHWSTRVGGAETWNMIAVDMMEIALWDMTSVKQVYYRIWEYRLGVVAGESPNRDYTACFYHKAGLMAAWPYENR